MSDVVALRFSTEVAPRSLDMRVYRLDPSMHPDNLRPDRSYHCDLKSACQYNLAGGQIEVSLQRPAHLHSGDYVVVRAFFFGLDAGKESVATSSWGFRLKR